MVHSPSVAGLIVKASCIKSLLMQSPSLQAALKDCCTEKLESCVE